MSLVRLGVISVLVLISVAAPTSTQKRTTVQEIVAAKLPALGHRNWIVVADSAYPLQTAPGIETITVGEGQLSAVKQALAALSKAKHVRPVIYVDSELEYVPESTVAGISRFRKDLRQVLKGKPVEHLLHEDIIAKLDEAGKTFKVLLIKTPHTMPYTSVFFQLECGYWSADAEQKLREAMKDKSGG
ncbi:MAG: hypothetical protein K1X67_22760 [Fimbriimonadaceae bacterium]|nr:hypothetical protein [Fimbriimonadaceae bacterium]